MAVDFTDEGYLYPGWHDYTIDRFKQDFVSNFDESITRKTIFNGFEQCITFFISTGLRNFELWVDGSYTTSKSNPGDIDFCIYIRSSDIDKLSLDNKDKLYKLLSEDVRKKIKQLLMCHIFFVNNVEDMPESKLKDEWLENRKYWIDFFSHDRDNTEKGIVRIVYNGGVDVV